METVIYGAQGVALGVLNSIKTIFPNKEIQCILVTQMGNNASTLGGIPVRELSEFVLNLSDADKENIEVLIGTPETVMGDIEKRLDDVGLFKHIRLDSLRWGKMQELAYVKSGKFMPLSAYPVGCTKAELQVYKMVNEKDKQLATSFTDECYVQRLQVGASLAKKEVTFLKDNEGDNISKRNGNYSELTGLYWMWKNRLNQEDDVYYGLAHYRRFLDFSEDDLCRLKSNDIDVVLPYPMPYEPNIEVHHERYLTSTEWNAVLRAVGELQPNYVEDFKNVLGQGYLYNYNVIVAKGKVLDDYCKWLFPILFRVEELNDPEGTKVPNRFIGYVGETLETLYFISNKNKLNISHATCRFLL